MRAHVKEQIAIVIGMLSIQVKALQHLKDKTEDFSRAAGIQDAIDILEEVIMIGMSITDNEIDTKHKNMKAALETRMANRIPNDN